MSDERAADGLEHLQQAAVEMIEAARAFLDVAEDLVRDPAAAATLVQTAAAMGKMLLHGSAGGAEGPATADEPKVRHIRVG